MPTNPNTIAEIQMPTVHLGGSSADALLNDLAEAAGAVRVAMRKLSETCPNGRDYYHNDAFTRAVNQHTARMQKLGAVLEDLEGIAENVSDQQQARRR